MSSFFDKYLGKKEEVTEVPAKVAEEEENTEKETLNTVQTISMKSIIPNRYQPRTEFDEDAITELSKTIDEHGLLQPIVVREYETGKFEIIAGERRFRAVKKLGWGNINAIVNNLTDRESASMALIENLQRENLNPIEEAEAYTELVKVNNLTQGQLSEQLGKSQSYIANKLRLLKLNPEVVKGIANNKITQRHGRALLMLDDDKQVKAYQQVVEGNLNVKQTEELVNKLLGINKKPKKTKEPSQNNNRDLKVSVNTLKKSIDLIKNTGADIDVKEKDKDDEYELIIRIKK